MSLPLGPRNPAVQHLRRLSGRRRARLDEGAFVVDGPTLVGDALDAGIELTAVYVDVAHDLDPELAARIDASGVHVFELAVGVLASAAATVTPNGVAAIARRPTRLLDQLTAPTVGMVVVLVGVSDPGNAGTLVRSAAAAGARAVVFCGGGVDPYSPKTVRSSAGAVFRLPVVEHDDASEVLDRFGAAGFTRLGTVARGGEDHDVVNLCGATALVLGNEAHGLPDALGGQLDSMVTIAMTDATESLNVAMAGTIVVFEMARQRRRNR